MRAAPLRPRDLARAALNDRLRRLTEGGRSQREAQERSPIHVEALPSAGTLKSYACGTNF